MIYFDNAASAYPKPPGVAEAMVHFLAMSVPIRDVRGTACRWKQGALSMMHERP